MKMMMTRATMATIAFSSPGSGTCMLSLPPHFLSSSHNTFHSKSLNFNTLDDALSSFNRMLHMHPPPSIADFTKLLISITKMKHYSTVLSLSHQMDSFGIPPNIYTLNILINSFCHLQRLGFAFSVLAKILKLGHQPNIATFNTLIRGLCVEGKIGEVLHLFDKMIGEGFQPNVVTYGTLINGYAKWAALVPLSGCLEAWNKEIVSLM
ncbi:Pentatricopeptide repeat-containing protein, mitochondrial [Vitis vinifera]|uniref:Pentatricopeptide repeat-containing protein, mitochondrial n=1 Tax=Vitis vinifera TaxID=29760 RepID=A0A438DRL4_VITVI|nr:Pentatricopeptide repeat-containing protein, mitochondrial [Vitis vinifera]